MRSWLNVAAWQWRTFGPQRRQSPYGEDGEEVACANSLRELPHTQRNDPATLHQLLFGDHQGRCEMTHFLLSRNFRWICFSVSK